MEYHHTYSKMIANIAGSQIAIEHGFHGPNYAVTTACSSATDAIDGLQSY